jgi:hypothetical protein
MANRVVFLLDIARVLSGHGPSQLAGVSEAS